MRKIERLFNKIFEQIVNKKSFNLNKKQRRKTEIFIKKSLKNFYKQLGQMTC